MLLVADLHRGVQALQEVWHAVALLNDLAEGPGALETLAAGLQTVVMPPPDPAAGALHSGPYSEPAGDDSITKGTQSGREAKQRRARKQKRANDGTKSHKQGWMNRLCCVPRPLQA